MEIFNKVLSTIKLSRKTKNAFDKRIQDIEPTWHLSNKRKSHTTEKERTDLAHGTGFSIIGDPVGDNYNDTGMFLCRCNECGWRKNLAKNYLVEKTTNCSMCLNIRLEKEANEKGLQFNGYTEDGDMKRRNYTFTKCGHSRDIATGDVRLGNFSCTECYSNSLDSALDKLGLENLGRPSSDEVQDPTQYYKVKYKSCGHIINALQMKILDGGIGKCKICYEDKLKQKYEPLYDIEILGTVSGAKRKIRFNKCLHEKVIALTNLKSGSFQCSICQVEKFKAEAKLVGLEYLGVTETRRTAGDPLHRYLAQCGHHIFSVTSHIRTGHWTCRTCNAGYLDNPNKLYLFKIVTPDLVFLKLGYSKSPEYRKYDYKLVEGTVTELLKVVEVPTGRDAIKYENEIHSKYSVFNYNKDVIKQYLTESGFTECYPIDILDELLGELLVLENRLKEKGINDE